MPADRTQLVEAWREVDLQHLAPGGREEREREQRGITVRQERSTKV